MSLLQLNPTIPVLARYGRDWQRSGKGRAVGWLDYSEEHDLLWVVVEDASGEVWIVPNKYIRVQPNSTLDRANVQAP